MNDSLSSLNGLDFTGRLASKAPVPGGGSVAAFIASLGASLGSMAANLTIGKEKYLIYEEEHRQIIAEADQLRRRFLELMDEDAAAFEPLSRIYSQDKNSEGYAERLLTATLNACRAPYEMAELCCELILLLEDLSCKCSTLLLSDVGCAALAARCALEAAAINVFVNTRMLPGCAEAELLADRTDGMLQGFLPRAQAVSDRVMTRLQSRKES